ESKGACMSIRYLRGVAKIEINLGILNSLAGSYDTAEKLWTHALEFFRSVGDEQTVASILNNIGGMMVLRRKFESAAANFKAAVIASVKANDRYTETISALNLAFCQAKLGYFEETRKIIDEISPLMKESFDLYQLAWLHLVNGIYNTYRGSWPEAEKNYQAALRFAQASGNVELIAYCHEEYGISLLERDKRKEAEEQMTLSREIVESIKKIELKGKLANF
ncbi:MAG: tetratricopeptide repeat protein, partial [Methanomassiliicoccales archaeon]